MKDITNNEMMFVLNIFKSPEIQHNANSLAKLIGISRMGALKIAGKLEKDRIISHKTIGKTKFYRLNLENDYVRQYVKFLLKREAEQVHPYVRIWIEDIRNIKNADAAVLFGSVLTKHKEARDVDLILIADNKRIRKLEKEIETIEGIATKRIHAVYMAKGDLENNIKKGNEAMMGAIKGIVVFGEDRIIEAIMELHK